MPYPIGRGHSSHSSVIRTPYTGVLSPSDLDQTSSSRWVFARVHYSIHTRLRPRVLPKIPRGPAGERLLK